MFFTTSWDDGYALDERVARMLDRHGMRGTFYICPQGQHGRQMLTRDQVRALGVRHEIGAHTLTHPKLTQVPPAQAREEIEGSRAWVEEVADSPCAMFCYPKGDWNPAVAQLVREAGYRGARTVRLWCGDAADRFAMPTTLQLFPFPMRGARLQWWHHLDPFGPLRAHWATLRRMGMPLRAMRSWFHLARHQFDYHRRRGHRYFHLWGHSHEIERHGLWGEFGAFLEYVAEQPNVHHVTNGQLADALFSNEGMSGR